MYVLIVLISISINTTLHRPVEYISYGTAGELEEIVLNHTELKPMFAYSTHIYICLFIYIYEYLRTGNRGGL